jgi:hypothetical protein
MSEALAGMYDVEISAAGVTVVSAPSRVVMLQPVVLDNAQFLSQSRTVMEGGTLKLGVQVRSGTPPFDYRWMRNGQVMASGGSANMIPELTVPWSDVSLAGSYSVSVVSAAGTVSSGSVWIGEVRRPAADNFIIERSLTNGQLLQGSKLTLTVKPKTVGGAVVPSNIQWRFNGALLRNGWLVSGGTTAALVLENISSSAVGEYQAVLRNDAGEAVLTESVAFGRVPVQKLGELAPLTVVQGDTVRWSAFEAEGEAPKYRWLKQGVTDTVGTSAVLSLGSVKASDAGLYELTVSNDLVSDSTKTLSFASSSARLRVLSPIDFKKLTVKSGTLVIPGTTVEINRSTPPLSSQSGSRSPS